MASPSTTARACVSLPSLISRLISSARIERQPASSKHSISRFPFFVVPRGTCLAPSRYSRPSEAAARICGGASLPVAHLSGRSKRPVALRPRGLLSIYAAIRWHQMRTSCQLMSCDQSKTRSARMPRTLALLKTPLNIDDRSASFSSQMDYKGRKLEARD